MRCSTFLSGDVNPANGTVSGTGRVRVTDVTAYRIVKPLHWATIDSGTAVPCTAYVRNQGTDPASVPVTFRIASWSDSRTTNSIAAGDSVKVGFNNWTALPRGRDSVRCTTSLAGDQVTGNNRVVDSVFVRVNDVGTLWIVRPSGGATYNLGPRFPARPMSPTTETLRRLSMPGCSFATRPHRDRELYRDSTQVVNLAPGAGLYVGFRSWLADTIATGLTARCTTGLAGDMRSANDFAANYFHTIGHDVTCYWIAYPPSGAVYDSGAAVRCSANVWNRGGQAETFKVRFRIYIGVANHYLDSTTLTLPSGSWTRIGFPNWTALQRGVYAARCSTCLGDDNNANNATTNTNITVRVRDVGAISIGVPLATIDSGPAVVPVCTTFNYGSSTEGYTVRFKIGSGLQPDRNRGGTPRRSQARSGLSGSAESAARRTFRRDLQYRTA